MMTRSQIALVAILAFALASCGGGGGGGGSPSTQAYSRIRLVNATGVTNTLSLNGAYSIANVPNNSVSSYESVPPGTYTANVGGLVQDFGLAPGQSYTALAYGTNRAAHLGAITDNLTIPGPGYANFNVANLSTDAGPLDVYLLTPGSTPQLGQATYQSVNGLTFASTFAAGIYDVIITGAGNVADVRGKLLSITFTTAQVGTIVLINTVGGLVVNAAIIINQGGSAQFFASNLARVRVVSVLPQANQSAVNVTVGTATNLPTVFAPTPSNYTLVPAYSTISAITVLTGTTITQTLVPPSIPGNNGAFAAGGDYTVLVYGPPSAPVAEVLLDNNQSIPNSPSVRLVNLAVPSLPGIELYVDNVRVTDPVAYGASSAYVGAQGSYQVPIQVEIPVPGPIGYTFTAPVSKSLNWGSVYSVFLYDAASPPLVIQDR